MDENKLIHAVSIIISNTLYGDQDFLNQLGDNSLLKLTVYEDAETIDINGCMRYGDDVFSFYSTASQKESYLIKANLKSKEMRVYTGTEGVNGETIFEEVQFGVVNPHGIVDLDANGRRWEGGVIGENQPHGYGEYYDENGNVEYECFVFDGKKVCYAKEYYSDIDQLKYEGTYGVDCRCGYGESFDRFGDDDESGIWYHNRPVGELSNPNHPVLPFLHNYLRKLSIGESDLYENNCNQFILLGCLVNLTSLHIDNNGLPYVHRFELNGLPNLREMTIGNNCIHMNETPAHLIITHCMSLKRILIGQNCFTNTQSVIMKGIFCRFEIVIVIDLPMLRKIEVNGGSILGCYEIVFEGIY